MHIHVVSVNGGNAKFWLEPVIALANYYNMNNHEIRKAQQIVEENHNAFKDAWKKHIKK